MATVTETSLKLTDITECSICLNSLKEPKVLPCIHTFCRQCLESYCKDKKSEEMACPLCRKAFSLPPGGVKDLSENFFINRLQSASKFPDTARATPTLCELCSDSGTEKNSTPYCIECDQHICDRCLVTHNKIKATQFHTVVLKNKDNIPEFYQVGSDANIPQAEEKIKRPGLIYCHEHPAEQNRLYCYDCNMITCHYCHLRKHNQHKLSDVSESADNFHKLLKCDIEHMAACNSRKRQQIIHLETDKKSFLEKIASTEQNISKKYDQLMHLIQSQKCQLMEELNQFKINMLKEVETEKVEITRKLMITESFEKYCQEMMNNGTACDISRAAIDLHARAEELLKIQNEPDCHRLSGVKITFEPSLSTTDRANNLLGKLILEDEAVSTIMEEAFDQKMSLIFFIDKPKLLYVKFRNNARTITGLTVLGEEVYVLRGTEHVNVYKTEDFASIRNFLIHGSTQLRKLVSCSHFNCLYINDYKQQIIYRYDRTNNVTTKWSVHGKCHGLSLTKCFNILVTLCDIPQIREYSTDGTFIREISLDSNINDSQHSILSIQLTTGNYVVSQYGTLNRVCIVDQSGHTIRSYGGSDVGQMNYPCRLCVDLQGNVLVANKESNRVLLLSPTLTYLGDIVIPGYLLSQPYVLYFDEQNHRLYIGEHEGRMFVLSVDKIVIK